MIRLKYSSCYWSRFDS